MTTNDNNAVVVFEPQNVATIAEIGPVAAKENKISHDRCIDAGRTLLDTVEAEGMSDELDMAIANYIEKARKTVRKMNDKRTPVTKLFDTIRTHFTGLEADVDPTKRGSIPAMLQEHRNKYAAKKREEEERRRRAEAARIAKEQATSRYKTEVEDDLKSQFNSLIVTAVNELIALDKQTTLENYAEIEKSIKAYSSKLTQEKCSSIRPGVRMPAELSIDESRKIVQDILTAVTAQYVEQYDYEVSSNKEDILMRLPSKKAELERMAKANAEEAARIKQQMEERERQEAARKEAERLEREAKEKAEQELLAKKQEMDGLFGAASVTVPGYQPKTQVKRRIEVLEPDGFMAIVGMWWSQKGCTMTVEELTKVFAKQITFCNQLANDKNDPVLISNEHIAYVDDVKAK